MAPAGPAGRRVRTGRLRAANTASLRLRPSRARICFGQGLVTGFKTPPATHRAVVGTAQTGSVRHDAAAVRVRYDTVFRLFQLPCRQPCSTDRSMPPPRTHAIPSSFSRHHQRTVHIIRHLRMPIAAAKQDFAAGTIMCQRSRVALQYAKSCGLHRTGKPGGSRQHAGLPDTPLCLAGSTSGAHRLQAMTDGRGRPASSWPV